MQYMQFDEPKVLVGVAVELVGIRDRLALVHFGVFEDVEAHLDRLRGTMHRWSEWVGHGMDEETFATAVHADVAASDPDDVDNYLTIVPAWHGFRGLERYWRKRHEASTGA